MATKPTKPTDYNSTKIEYSTDAVKRAGYASTTDCPDPKLIQSAQLAIEDCDDYEDEMTNKLQVEIGEGAQNNVDTVEKIKNPDQKDL